MFFVGVFLDLPMRASMAIYASFLPSRSKATTQPQILKLKKKEKRKRDRQFLSLFDSCNVAALSFAGRERSYDPSSYKFKSFLLIQISHLKLVEK